MLVLGALLFSPGMIPTYLVVTQFGLIDSYWALILPVLVNAFNVIVMRAFFHELPHGAHRVRRGSTAPVDDRSSFTIVLPLSKAVLAVVGLFYAVGYWNAFFNALLSSSPRKWPMALVLRPT